MYGNVALVLMTNFLFTDDIEIYLDSFNSNWTCGCKIDIKPFINSEDSQFKLTLTHYTDSNDHDMDFEENFNAYHSIKPNCNY